MNHFSLDTLQDFHILFERQTQHASSHLTSSSWKARLFLFHTRIVLTFSVMAGHVEDMTTKSFPESCMSKWVSPSGRHNVHFFVPKHATWHSIVFKLKSVLYQRFELRFSHPVLQWRSGPSSGWCGGCYFSAVCKRISEKEQRVLLSRQTFKNSQNPLSFPSRGLINM